MRMRNYPFSTAKIILGLTFFLSACSGEPSRSDISGPAWIKQSARTVDAGYIVYVGSGEDHSPEKAKFKAEAEAYQDLANECSFPPKGTRVEDRFERTLGNLHQTYVKVAVDYQSCEEAKQALAPEQIRKLANVTMTEEIKRYHEMIDESDDETNPEDEMSPETKAMLEAQNAPPEAHGNGSIRWVIHDQMQWYVVRQQILYAKQDVILAPPTQYQPGTPQTQTFINHVTLPAQASRQFEVAHPELKSAPVTYTGLRKARVNAVRGVNRGNRLTPPKRAGNMHSPSTGRKENPRGNKRKRKRGFWDSGN